MSYTGFRPIADENSRVLILGSFPSVISRKRQFYYGNPRNRFWHLLGDIYGMPVDTQEDKLQLCAQCGIALWDIVAECDVQGSADSKLVPLAFADVDSMVSGSSIRRILCNGALAYKLTLQQYHGGLPVVRLPSTSPANVRFDAQIWRANLIEQ